MDSNIKEMPQKESLSLTPKTSPTVVTDSSEPVRADSSEEEAKRKKSLLLEINRIDNWTSVASDNGLFDHQKKVPTESFKDIQDDLKRARDYLNLNNLVESDYYSSFALRAYYRALYSALRLWRFSNIYV